MHLLNLVSSSFAIKVSYCDKAHHYLLKYVIICLYSISKGEKNQSARKPTYVTPAKFREGYWKGKHALNLDLSNVLLQTLNPRRIDFQLDFGIDVVDLI